MMMMMMMMVMTTTPHGNTAQKYFQNCDKIKNMGWLCRNWVS
jgi:hypothetical protein